MKISQLKAQVAQDEVGAVITILDPTAKPYLSVKGTPCTMTVLGLQSEARKAAPPLAWWRGTGGRRRMTLPSRANSITSE